MGGFVPTSGKGGAVSFKEAVLTNVPSQGGLFIPESLTTLSQSDLEKISGSDFPTTAQIILEKIIGDEIPAEELLDICKKAFAFEVPVKILSPILGVLELFHGPTQAFKDVGVRFMAEIIQRFSPTETRTILTATSGDTGAAVAGAFFKRPNTRVIVLYPKGKISGVQEQQIAGLGENVEAYAVVGSFDDCQKMVNEVFSNKKLVDSLKITSANSINLARLLPQTAYYAHAWAQARSKTKLPLLFSIPSGNFGNVCAGLIAKKMGVPIDYLLAATNDNDVVPKYLAGDEFRIKEVKETITTAMDIAVPNNFPRVESLFGPGASAIAKSLYSTSVTIDETKAGMRELYSKYQYVSDPHGALAYFAAINVLTSANLFRVFLETAHPVKFPEVVQEVIGVELSTNLHRKILCKEIGTNPSELIAELNKA
jgi:threonine synthase